MIEPPRPVSLIPESAPFSAEQRLWLSGLFAGLLSLEGGVTPLSPEQASALFPGALGDAAPREAAAGEDDDAPWHDPAMPLGDRMQLAEGRPLRRRMMAAMGQQDCGQCGYSCQDYSDAIFSEKEKRLNLCVPGGKETARVAQGAAPGAWAGAGRQDPERDPYACRCYGCSGRRAGMLARVSGRGDVPGAHAPE
jgi:sulfite reductase (NADPH) flavoprotein alpha-component